MKVSACLVTRGNVDLEPIIESIPRGWEIVIWDNGEKMVTRSDGYAEVATDLSVYGRYAAIEHATHDLIYVQDDDVIVEDPQAIVDALVNGPWVVGVEERPTSVVCNMPQEFRHEGYTDSALVGFGAAFHRDAPKRAFDKFMASDHFRGMDLNVLMQIKGDRSSMIERTCDVVFTTLTERVLVDVPKVDREFASDPDRMWKQPGHHGERTRMLALARAVRDA